MSVAGLILMILTMGFASAQKKRVTVLFLYTPDSNIHLGGIDALNATANMWMARTNNSFEQSGIDIRLAKVGMKRVGHNEKYTSNHIRELRLMRTQKEAFRNLDRWRKRVAADITCLLVATSNPNVAGRAYQLSPEGTPSGNANDAVCTVSVINSGDLSFAHEVGHIFGSNHTRGDTRSDQQRIANKWGYPKYAWAHFFTGLSGNKYRTIMGYLKEDEFPIDHFSNPSRRYDGVRTGTSRSNNRKLFNSNRKIVSRYSQFR